MQKPSERLARTKKATEAWSASFSDDEIAIATLSNMMHKVGEILDELEEKLTKERQKCKIL